MVILRQKEYGLVSGLGTLAGHAVSNVGTGVAATGLLGGAAIHKAGGLLLAHPIGAGLLAGYGLYRLIKRRRARRAEQNN